MLNARDLSFHCGLRKPQMSLLLFGKKITFKKIFETAMFNINQFSARLVE